MNTLTQAFNARLDYEINNGFIPASVRDDILTDAINHIGARWMEVEGSEYDNMTTARAFIQNWMNGMYA